MKRRSSWISAEEEELPKLFHAHEAHYSKTSARKCVNVKLYVGHFTFWSNYRNVIVTPDSRNPGVFSRSRNDSLGQRSSCWRTHNVLRWLEIGPCGGRASSDDLRDEGQFSTMERLKAAMGLLGIWEWTYDLFLCVISHGKDRVTLGREQEYVDPYCA